jgi:hypothetical protein
MADTDIFSLAKVLGAKNITNNTFANSPSGRNFILQNERANSAQRQLDATQTPLGAISSGIALYVQRKRENQALQELNAQMQAEQEVKAARRESLINALPEANRVIGNALSSDEDLAKYAIQTLTPPKEEDILSLENKRLQNQKLKSEVAGGGGNDLDRTYKYLQTQKLERELDGTIPSKPLPVQAVKLQDEALNIIGTANGINSDLDQVSKQLESSKLKLGPVENLKSQARNAAGFSSPESRNFASFRATLEKQRNDSLRLNKGVQTEGDAQRAWNELFNNLNDKDVVQQRLGEIQKINKRGSDLQKLQVDQIRANYGAQPLDYSQFENRPAALGTAGNGSFQSSKGVKFTIKR